MPYEISTLDPHAEDTASAYAVLGHFYEGLVATDAEMRIVPALAERWETPDDRTWVFHLRQGATFADGRPFEAADAVYSIDRLKNGVGLEVAGYAAHIETVEAIDAHTLKIRTTRPLSVLLNKMAFLSVVPRGATTETLKKAPLGTGPYRLLAWTPQSVRMARRDGYWGPRPALRAVEFRLARTPEQAAQDLVEGRAQLAQCSSRQAEALLGGKPGLTLERRPSLFVKYLGFNVAKERLPGGEPNPFRDPRVREAIDLALDRERLVRELPQDAEPATQYVPSTIFGFDPGIPPRARDLARARALLAEAGLGPGRRLPLVARQILAGAADTVKGQLREAGLELDLEVVEDRVFFERARAREVYAHVSRFGCPTGDASDLFDNAFHTLDRARGVGRINYSEYTSAEVDRLMDESAGLGAVQERRGALHRVMNRVLADRPWLPLYADRETFAFQAGLQWQPRNDGYLRAADVRWAP